MENKLGTIQKFEVLRETNIGYMLTIDGDDEFFLHKNESNFQHLNSGDIVNGFVYSDKKSRIAVTLVEPIITVDKSGFVKVVDVNKNFGAFVDIGISKDILLSKDDLPLEYADWPEPGDILLCTLKVKSERLIVKMLNKYEILDLDLHYELPLNEKVEGYVYRKTEDGINIVTKTFNIIFVYKSNMREKYRLGEHVNVKVIKKNVDDYAGTFIESKAEIIEEDSQKILDYLNKNHGVMTITDKSDPLVIYKAFNISKKAFKNAVGLLYKQKKIEIFDDKILLM